MNHFFSFAELVGTAIKKYRLEYLIEQNAFGAIFLARCPDTRQMYQFRLLNGSEFSPEEQLVYLERFQHEASKIAALQHPAIHPLLEYGDHNGMPYLISSYIPPHHSLATRLKTSGPIDMDEAGNYMDTLTSALEYAHQHAILHGNLTPDAIFITPTSPSESPSVIVADIGVASLQMLSKQNNRQEPMPIRQSPSEELGDPKQNVDRTLTPASDTSALGAILYQMVTGYHVLDSEQKEHTMEELSHHISASHALFSRRKAISLIAATGATAAIAGTVWAKQRDMSITALQQEMSLASENQANIVIARAAAIPANNAFPFKLPQNGDPALLIHLPNSNKFVAFDAVCTHEGCTVQYNSQTQLIECNCHGSVFDPTKNAAVVHGPAHTPLTAVPITINANGTITLAGQAPPPPLASQTSIVIARVAAIPANKAFKFKVPQNGDPALLIHLPNSNKFVAFDAICTHKGCTVQYNSQTQLIDCHCHGSVFDPTNNAAVVHGPAHTPLAPIPLTINADGTISVSGTVCGSASSSSSHRGDN